MSLRVDSPLLAAADLRLADDLFTAVGQLRRHGRRLGGGPFPAGALSGAQVELVRLVRRRPGLSVAEAAAELALAPNTVSTLVGQLAEVDVLTRVADPRDRRVARLALTTPAKERIERWRDQRAAVTAGAIADLGLSERAALERAVPIIARLAAALGPAPDAPGSPVNQVRDE
ncbi:MAG TPA: MarR family transcriptional regulator [Propionibacteriaceae bacterium]